jgi:hypothetical protein
MIVGGSKPKLDRRESDLRRVADDRPDWTPDVGLVMARVTTATVLGVATDYRWTYECAEAWMNGTVSAVRSPGRTFSPCYSISELSNGLKCSYGVTIANLPVGFAPVRIPNDTAVMLSPHRKSDGTLVWIIINTQAIDGVCPE